MNIVQEKAVQQLAAWDKAVGRERQVLDTNLYQSGFSLRDSESNRYPQQRAREGEAGGNENRCHMNGYSTYEEDVTPPSSSKY